MGNIYDVKMINELVFSKFILIKCKYLFNNKENFIMMWR